MANVRAFVTSLVIPSIFLIASPVVLAATVPAGFAPGQVWLSQTTPAAGSSVRVFTVVYDGGATALEGSVSFKIDGTTVGSSPFSLEPGESAIESVTWVAVEGTHQVSAEITSVIEKKTKQSATLDHASTTSISVQVGAAAPKPAALEAIDTAQTAVASSSPVVASVVAATTATTESIRKAGEAYLTQLVGGPGASTAASTTKPKGSVLGASIENPDATTTTKDTSGSYVQKIAKGLLPLFRYPALFYPFFILLTLFVGWLILKKLRDPKKR